jgi:photosystem II stability/assembly factor-like uncharacterized protein
MAITWAYVTTAFPRDAALAAVGDEGSIYVAWAQERANTTVMGGSADQVHALLAAHYATLAGALAGGGASGPITSVSAGPYSQSHAAPIAMAGGEDLQGTTYGRQAWGLMRVASFAAAPFMVV